MSNYRLTTRAEADIIDIFTFGLEWFGPMQSRRYKDELANCFEMIAENPRIGRLASGIGPGIRRHEHGSHVILYEEEAAGVLILAVVHGRSIRRLKL